MVAWEKNRKEDRSETERPAFTLNAQGEINGLMLERTLSGEHHSNFRISFVAGCDDIRVTH